MPVGPPTWRRSCISQPVSRRCCGSASVNWSVPTWGRPPGCLASCTGTLHDRSAQAAHVTGRQACGAAPGHRSWWGSPALQPRRPGWRPARPFSGLPLPSQHALRTQRAVLRGRASRQTRRDAGRGSSVPCRRKRRRRRPALPPGKVCSVRALSVSPAAGRRSTLSTRSMLMEPTTSSGLPAAEAAACARAGQRALRI